MSGYQTDFKEAIAQYQMLDAFDIDNHIVTLDSALYEYSKDQKASNLTAVESAFAPIANYYQDLSDINLKLQTFLDKASTLVEKSQDVLINQERYYNRVNPEESVESREILFGILPSLKVRSIPYILAAGVFMACMSIFMIFQLGGMSANLNLPPALVTWWSTPSVGPPFYKNPLVLSGVIIALVVALTIVLIQNYFITKKQ